jgi:hypothetical protein
MQIQNMRIAMGEAGRNLSAYQSFMYTGVGLQMGGAVILGLGLGTHAASSTAINTSPGKPLMVVGGVMMGIGYVMSLTAHSYIGNAGAILKQNGIVLPIKGRNERRSKGASQQSR